jgi:hypothetical protein
MQMGERKRVGCSHKSKDTVHVAAGEPTHTGGHRTGAGVQVVSIQRVIARAPHEEVGVATWVAVAHTFSRCSYDLNVLSWALWFGHRRTLSTYTQNA